MSCFQYGIPSCISYQFNWTLNLSLQDGSHLAYWSLIPLLPLHSAYFRRSMSSLINYILDKVSFASSLSIMPISYQVSLTAIRHMLFSSLKNPKAMELGLKLKMLSEMILVMVLELELAMELKMGHPQVQTWREPLIFN